MQQYLNLLETLLTQGHYKDDRTKTGTYSIFGHQMRFNLAEGFPLVTTKKIFMKGIIHELLWFLKGDTNIKYLTDNGVHIWDEWADENGNLGPIYGEQWRKWKTFKNLKSNEVWNDAIQLHYIDQITDIINEIKTNPTSRRLIVSAWNPSVLPNAKLSPQDNVRNNKQALPPCHTLFQFYVIDGKLSCQLYSRSQDCFLGTPFNIASYSLLTMMIAHVCGLEVGDYIHTSGDVHIYKNHLEQVKLQLTRKPYPLPKLIINRPVNDIFDFHYEDFTLIDYHCHPAIKAPVAI